MNFFDTHSHITKCIHHMPLEEQILRMKENGVTHVLDAGIIPSDFEERYELLKGYDNVLMGVAFGPHYVNASNRGELKLVEEIIQKYHPVALSEIGLDYLKNPENKTLQHEIFIQQLEISKKYELPYFLHIRDAYDDTAEVIRKEGGYLGVVHCFSGTQADAKKFLDLGCYISFSGIVTFKNAKEIQEVAMYCPLDKILVETDSPYLSPVPHRGKDNNSSWVIHVAQFIAEMRGESTEKVIDFIYKNSLKVLAMD